MVDEHAKVAVIDVLAQWNEMGREEIGEAFRLGDALTADLERE